MTADQVREDNAELDRRLLGLARLLDPARLPERDGEEAWSAAQVLAHLGEFPHFFAGDLRRWLADPQAPVGRTVEHEDRLAAVAAATRKDRAELVADMATAFADLDDALGGLREAHLSAPMHNRKYGAEPLPAFLDRYVLGHKRAHLDQLANQTPAGRDAST